MPFFIHSHGGHTLTDFSLQELRKQFQIISELRTEIKTLQADNLKLYEKVRYMQSYREDSGSRPVTQLDPLPAPSARLDDMSKYQARYEEAMNPFEAFRGRVSSRLICEVKLTNWIGSNTGLSSPQPCGTWGPHPDAFDPWKSSCPNVFHLLRASPSLVSNVYDIRVYRVFWNTATETTKPT